MFSYLVLAQANQSFSVDSIPSIAIGGTIGLISFLGLVLWLFYTNKIKSTSSDEKLEKILSGVESSLKSSIDSDKIREETLRQVFALLKEFVEEYRTNAEIERRVSDELKKRQSTPRTRGAPGD